MPPTPIGQLALAWLSCREGGSGAAGDLRKALTGFARLAAPGALAAALDELVAGGLVTRGRKLTLTDAGRAAAAELTGAAEGTRPSWKAIAGPALLERLLELPPAKRDADGLRAALIAREHQLGDDAGRGKARALDALGWKLLGIDRQGPFSRGAVIVELVRRATGSAGKDLDDTFVLLAARAVEARGSKSSHLRDAVLRRWLGGGAAPPDPDEDTLEAFAARVNAAARAAETGRFGPNKVFIAHVQRLVGGDPAAFKARLLEAHRAGLVALSRADLVEAMDPRDVRESEINYLSASFHFVRTDEAQP